MKLTNIYLVNNYSAERISVPDNYIRENLNQKFDYLIEEYQEYSDNIGNHYIFKTFRNDYLQSDIKLKNWRLLFKNTFKNYLNFDLKDCFGSIINNNSAPTLGILGIDSALKFLIEISSNYESKIEYDKYIQDPIKYLKSSDEIKANIEKLEEENKVLREKIEKLKLILE